MTAPLAIYIHWPYCHSKCPYCDFNSHVMGQVDHAAWRQAYRREVETYAALLSDRQVRSIFFGGGTPSLMQPETVAAIIDTIAARWKLADDIEITLEANPNSAEADRFAAFRAAGVNRLSLGVQALDDAALKFLGRAHGADEARRAIALAARHFPRYSFDLIYARRDQSMAAWDHELTEALSLAGEHLSLYQLTLEPGTVFQTRANKGEILTAPDAESVCMYELTQDRLRTSGLPAYEVSNHAKPGAESRHNLTYWRYDDYIGIGPGAHGRYLHDGVRYATVNHRAPESWLAIVDQQGQGRKECESISQDIAKREALMMGLRLASGIDAAAWQRKFGAPLLNMVDAAKLDRLRAEHYLTADTDKLRATPAGMQRLNAMLVYLLD